MKTLLLLLPVLLAHSALAQTSTLGETDSYAWAANIGWLQLITDRPTVGDGIRVTDTHLSGYGWSDSTGWINFGDGTPANNIRYANTDGADSGVNQDGAGNLSGLAWSANLGWINFGWAAASNSDRPRFDLLTGAFSGYAWSANAGWITLGTDILRTDTLIITDSDNDGISDAWELERAGNLTTLTSSGDADKDGVSDRKEYIADTNPLLGSNPFQVTAIYRTEGGTNLLWNSRPTRLYRMYRNTNLTGVWLESSLGLFLPDSGAQTFRYFDHPKSPRNFFRVQSFLPFSP